MSKILRLLRSIIPSIIFNFHYLPFRQAIKLPILCYKVDFKCLKGKIVIDSDKIYTGMIRLGFPVVRAYPNNGLSFSNEGTITFKGCVNYGGGNSGLVTLKSGHIIFGPKFNSTAGGLIISAKKIEFGTNVMLGWSVKIIDTNFHPLYDLKQNKFKKGYGAIRIGNNVWFGTESLILHSCTIPDETVFAAKSVITAGCKLETQCLHGGIPAKVIERGVMRPIKPNSITNYDDND